MLLLASLLAACGCGERSVRERCDDVEARLTAELAALPTGCRRDADCQPVQLSCGRLHLTSARRRFLFGRTLEGGPSPFVREISDDLVRFVRAGPGRKKKNSSGSGDSQMGLFS